MRPIFCAISITSTGPRAFFSFFDVFLGAFRAIVVGGGDVVFAVVVVAFVVVAVVGASVVVVGVVDVVASVVVVVVVVSGRGWRSLGGMWGGWMARSLWMDPESPMDSTRLRTLARSSALIRCSGRGPSSTSIWPVSSGEVRESR